ncbi:terpenoid synthase [Armillaria novae-zelandiae]|uniref:Terpene synthase n=1 Tax=Armillaria novae-zelandiae TaxID=153914 RepID=A0AA39NT97_9AGAR|nr:terpenoid synthase [Armillaria novae-zelandiae]
MPTPQTYTVPNLLAGWPFKATPNPHAAKINAESAAWVASYGVFSNKDQTIFDQWNFGAFAALAYSKAGPAQYRAGVDLINFYFVFDELSDKVDGPTVRKQADAIMNSLRNPYAPPPPHEHILGIMARDFWIRALEEGRTSPSTARRFTETFAEYTDAVVQQAEDRDLGRIRPIEEYLVIRRGTVGVRPSLEFFLLSEDVPDEAIRHPQVEKLVLSVIDMCILANDIYSFNVEQSYGDENHNIVSVTMAEKGLSIQQAIDCIAERYTQVSKEFLKDMKHIPIFPEPTATYVRKYVLGMAYWVCTDDDWSFITPRYFGEAAAEVQVHRVVQFLPKRS